ncbi:MAG TPA: hypothetical protein VME47_11370 [Acetobacteraceae bacterium]|nr:hypothetical protein [Acetobacteraceae bacterium]
MFAEDRLERMLLICLPVMIVLLGCGASLVRPHLVMDVLDVITAWTGTSIPLAVLIGHCALNED